MLRHLHARFAFLLSISFTLLLFTSLPFASSFAYQGKEVKVFDGKTLNGWEGNLNLFRVEDSAIVGGTMTAPIARNEFLCTRHEYDDFVLRLRVKLLGDPARANAGIQFRSRRIPNDHEVIGYQADMGQQYWGALYDESRRRKILAQPDVEALNKVLKRGEWNEYVIHAEGKHIRLSLNGYRTVDYTEPEDGIEQKGLICVQIHGGPPSEAWYKDISLFLLFKSDCPNGQ
jgi:hypothetical protein